MNGKLSNNTMLKYFNNQLPVKDMERVSTIINHSENYKNILNELEATYHLTNEKEQLENNPLLFSKICNKLQNNKKQATYIGTTWATSIFKPIMALAIIAITLYTGFAIGNLASNTNATFTALKYSSEFHFNDLQLEKMETVLLTKE